MENWQRGWVQIAMLDVENKPETAPGLRLASYRTEQSNPMQLQHLVTGAH
jgi:hypothetical protein